MGLSLFLFNLDGTVYFIGSDASCAYIRFSDSPVGFFHSYCLNIRVPLSSCMSVGVGYRVSRYLSLTADLALS